MLLDDYLPLQPLGHGSTGIVFLARGKRSRLTQISHLQQEHQEEDRQEDLQSLSCRDPGSTPVFAVKAFSKRSNDTLLRSHNEEAILSRLDHPFLPTLYSAFDHGEHRFLVLDFCPGGDLNTIRHFQPERKFSPAAIRFYAAEIVLALEHLHSKGVVYRDLKPENILLSGEGHIMLTDFDRSTTLSPKKPKPYTEADSSSTGHDQGLKREKAGTVGCLLHAWWSHTGDSKAKIMPAETPSTSSGSTMQSPSRPDARSHSHARGADEDEDTQGQEEEEDGGEERSHSFVGTEDYVAPEVILGTGHEYAVDWWALGVLLYEMAQGCTPFRGATTYDTFRNIVHEEPQFLGPATTLRDLTRRLLAKDPARRLGFASGAIEVRAHPFFCGVQWHALAHVSRPPFIPFCIPPLGEPPSSFQVKKHIAEVEFARAERYAWRKVAEQKERAKRKAARATAHNK